MGAASAEAVTCRSKSASCRPGGRDFITFPADIIPFGGARGDAKTVGSLLDFWYHAIEHGPNALGLMVRHQRTDLKDTQLAAMNIYGNAAQWRRRKVQSKGCNRLFRCGK
jgi:hypothetical protein